MPREQLAANTKAAPRIVAAFLIHSSSASRDALQFLVDLGHKFPRTLVERAAASLLQILPGVGEIATRQISLSQQNPPERGKGIVKWKSGEQLWNGLAA